MARSPQDPENPWFYNPSIAAAIIISHVYFLTTTIHIFQAFHYRTRYFISLIIGGAWETVGYGIRAAGTRKEDSVGLYASQLTLIVLAPAFVAAFNYMLFGRLLCKYSSDARALGISAAWVTRIFVGLENLPGASNIPVKEWRPLLLCLYSSCILIILRSVYRVVEFAQGFNGYLASHEVYFYVLEAVPMMPPFILFNLFHPGRIVKGGFGISTIEAT